MKTFLTFLVCASALVAHPMGNFSVSHFSRLQVTPRGVELRYVLDLAEIPTFELLRTWKVDRSAGAAEINARANEQAREWLSHLIITSNDRTVHARLESVKATIADGAGNLPILRADMRANIDATPGTLAYEDQNYSQRAGWKEIIVDATRDAALVQASQSNQDLSKALTQYPPDPTIAPPQDLRAGLNWKVTQPLLVAKTRKASAPGPPQAPDQPSIAPLITGIAQPQNAPAASSPATLTAQSAPAGSVIRGDFLSRVLHQRELSLSMILIALAVSFGLGAVHALTPGHGKAIVAAYLVGSRGTLKHAAFLGAMVTLTHTVTVFALGLATLFLFRFIVPEKITVILGALSGISIVVIGALMLQRRIQGARHTPTHSHSHSHAHDHAHPHVHEHVHTHSHEQIHEHAHVHEHVHQHAHVHEHAHAGGHAHLHTHSHDGPAVHTHTHDHHEHSPGAHTHSHGFGSHTHSHMPDEISWGGLVALGASGGLVPCESALILLLGAIALGRVGLGLLLLLSFSLGLALVLMLIGVLVLYAKNLLPESARSGSHPFLRWASIASPAIVIIVGLLMTAASLGWIQSKWMIG